MVKGSLVGSGFLFTFTYTSSIPVDKERFHLLIQNYTVLDKSEVDELIQLQSLYPYSQVIHNILSRGSSDLELSEKDKYLHRSAIYSTDRSVLKSVMTSPRLVIRAVQNKNSEVALEAIHSENEASLNLLVSTNTGDDLYTEVINDLDQLSKSKLRFEEVVKKLERETAKPLAALDNETSINIPVVNEVIIEEIKTSKKKIEVESSRHKEQTEIIDQFIKTQPSISPAKSVQPKAEDLSDKYDIYGENIVSETLVEILLKQGKKEKAVEKANLEVSTKKGLLCSPN